MRITYPTRNVVEKCLDHGVPNDDLTYQNNGGQFRCFITSDGIGFVYSYAEVIAVFWPLTRKAVVTDEKFSLTTTRHTSYALYAFMREGYEIHRADPRDKHEPLWDEWFEKGGRLSSTVESAVRRHV